MRTAPNLRRAVNFPVGKIHARGRDELCEDFDLATRQAESLSLLNKGQSWGTAFQCKIGDKGIPYKRLKPNSRIIRAATFDKRPLWLNINFPGPSYAVILIAVDCKDPIVKISFGNGSDPSPLGRVGALKTAYAKAVPTLEPPALRGRASQLRKSAIVLKIGRGSDYFTLPAARVSKVRWRVEGYMMLGVLCTWAKKWWISRKGWCLVVSWLMVFERPRRLLIC